MGQRRLPERARESFSDGLPRNTRNFTRPQMCVEGPRHFPDVLISGRLDGKGSMAVAAWDPPPSRPGVPPGECAAPTVW